MKKGIDFHQNLNPLRADRALFQREMTRAGDVMETRSNHFVDVLGRLKAGLTPAEAQADIRVISARIRQEFSGSANMDATSAGLLETIVGDVRLPLLLLMFAALQHSPDRSTPVPDLSELGAGFVSSM